MNFQPFDKIPRLSRDMIITEKIDGTNAQVALFRTHKSYNGEFFPFILHQYEPDNEYGDRLVLMAGSRTRWITPGKDKDNMGFAGWVLDHKDDLLKLGEGTHYGEWWGKGIQRSYDLKEKRFSLFNVSRWTSEFNNFNINGGDVKDGELSTVCIEVPVCHVAPLIFIRQFDSEFINEAIEYLKYKGSLAAPGFMKPEGIVIYHVAGDHLFKKTIENDDKPKSTGE